ncbi:MAG: ZIP family metal transporter [Candidatus Buchananbacteria bacterium]
MTVLFFALIAAFIISAISLVGALSMVLNSRILDKVLLLFVSFSAGSMIGGAFFHLLPEAIDLEPNVLTVSVYLLCGFCLFFILERVLRWHHCHHGTCEAHQHLGWLNLIGDCFHNFIDGLVIVSAFAVSPILGFTVTLSIVFHEIPQELGDFGVLLYSGFSKARALFYNFLSACTSIVGVVLGFFLLDNIAGINIFLLSFAAGGFIYIAASDLIPEIHEEKETGKSIFAFLIFLVALVMMFILKLFGAE